MYITARALVISNQQDQGALASTSDVKPSTSDKSKKNPKQNKRSMEKFRAKKSEKFDAENKKLLYNKLYYGFKLQSDAMQWLKI